jgi:hypothetical protein
MGANLALARQKKNLLGFRARASRISSLASGRGGPRYCGGQQSGLKNRLSSPRAPRARGARSGASPAPPRSRAARVDWTAPSGSDWTGGHNTTRHHLNPNGEEEQPAPRKLLGAELLSAEAEAVRNFREFLIRAEKPSGFCGAGPGERASHVGQGGAGDGWPLGLGHPRPSPTRAGGAGALGRPTPCKARRAGAPPLMRAAAISSPSALAWTTPA